MGYVGKLDKKIQAMQLRKTGLSYKEILQHVDVSKDTLSRWCRDIELSHLQKDRLIKNKQLGQHKGSIIAAEKKKIQRIELIKTIHASARQELGKRTSRDRFITGIALYAGEGNKTEGSAGFTNANPHIIKFMSRWLREFGKLPLTKLHGAIWLHEGLDEAAAISFWSKISGIPQNQFYKTYFAANKINSKKVRKNIHAHGVFAIKFSDLAVQRRILGWISALINDRISLVP